MEMNAAQVEAVVRQVLNNISGTSVSTTATAGPIPSKVRVGMLTELGKMEIKEFPMPEVGDNDLLVR